MNIALTATQMEDRLEWAYSMPKTERTIRPRGAGCCNPLKGMNDDLYKATRKPSEIDGEVIEKTKVGFKMGREPI